MPPISGNALYSSRWVGVRRWTVASFYFVPFRSMTTISFRCQQVVIHAAYLMARQTAFRSSLTFPQVKVIVRIFEEACWLRILFFSSSNIVLSFLSFPRRWFILSSLLLHAQSAGLFVALGEYFKSSDVCRVRIHLGSGISCEDFCIEESSSVSFSSLLIIRSQQCSAPAPPSPAVSMTETGASIEPARSSGRHLCLEDRRGRIWST